VTEAATEEQVPTPLSVPGQTYVVVVGLVALMSHLGDSHLWFVLLVLMALPLSLVAMWVGFYAVLAFGFVLDGVPGDLSWGVTVVWVAVWTATAWVNARMGERVLQRGWVRALGRP
jgi:hypothetical protein